LFRSLAFKYGRFLEVDENTKDFKRCDMARVKILTAEKTAIDSYMVVSVLGRRFEIRVFEESGSDNLGVRSIAKREFARPDEQSSRASGEEGSYQAVVEGFSETGSDADVSESCQVLLGLEAHGKNMTVTSGGLEVVEYAEEVGAGLIPNNLGNLSMLTKSRVNPDSDIGGGICAVSEQVIPRLEGVKAGCLGGTPSDDVSNSGGTKDAELSSYSGEKEVTLDLAREGGDGSAQFANKGPFVMYEGEVGCIQHFYDPPRPKVLRTRNGDICFAGPSSTHSGGVDLVGSPIFKSNGKAQAITKKKKVVPFKHSTNSPHVEAGANRKAQYKRTIPELPFNNKLKKFSNLSKSRANQKRKSNHRMAPKGSSSSSDSIQNSEASSVPHVPLQQAHRSEVMEDFILEVVLPCLPVAVADSTSVVSASVANHQGSGMECLLQIDDDVGRRRSILEVPPRQMMEANRIVELQEVVGIKVLENKENHLNRIIAMEDRDRAEKEGWEMNRETVGSQ
jgi:hypothetical protein